MRGGLRRRGALRRARAREHCRDEPTAPPAAREALLKGVSLCVVAGCGESCGGEDELVAHLCETHCETQTSVVSPGRGCYRSFAGLAPHNKGGGGNAHSPSPGKRPHAAPTLEENGVEPYRTRLPRQLDAHLREHLAEARAAAADKRSPKKKIAAAKMSPNKRTPANREERPLATKGGRGFEQAFADFLSSTTKQTKNHVGDGGGRLGARSPRRGQESAAPKSERRASEAEPEQAKTEDGARATTDNGGSASDRLRTDGAENTCAPSREAPRDDRDEERVDGDAAAVDETPAAAARSDGADVRSETGDPSVVARGSRQSEATTAAAADVPEAAPVDTVAPPSSVSAATSGAVENGSTADASTNQSPDVGAAAELDCPRHGRSRSRGRRGKLSSSKRDERRGNAGLARETGGGGGGEGGRERRR
ncbi:PREDICTED: muscle M-line assembly protein unc-89-like [Priapulus caudatus]|uniref:Muscle M-line assembly protein unc-89-like n=1 Tax=Priapulus caudatus TaxID=37621 RepID=A0ABM1EQS8_PRICU|nr:PREDICTED: muscle M-line assembly protein unc-89-like [Priapulus caudatus]